MAGLREIKSKTRNGAGIIRMEFDFGVNTDLAFIEVNEKIDATMNSLPKEAEPPKAIKASATDIPVLYLNMTLKNNRAYEEMDEQQFLTLCELAENVVKRHIEQLPEVAMADITGIPGRMLQIVPDAEKLFSTGVTIADIENALAVNNVEPRSMLVRDGYYEYNIRIATLLRTSEDVENIHIRKGDRLMQLKDLCKVAVVSQKEQGLSVAGRKRTVTLDIIKQSDEDMDEMKAKLKETTDYFATLYPDIDFQVCRNQTELLDYTISNLQDNFTIGFLLIFIVTIYFLGDVRSLIVIGLSMTVSVVITFSLFYFFKVSLNVISLSGLILAVGMMVDNSIIVTENIRLRQLYSGREFGRMDRPHFIRKIQRCSHRTGRTSSLRTLVPLYMDIEQSELCHHHFDRFVCRIYPEKRNTTIGTKVLSIGGYWCVIGCRRMVMELSDAGHQETVDQFHGASNQRMVLLVNGCILLDYRPQRLV